MHTQTITAPTAKVLNTPCVIAAEPADQFSTIARCSGVVASEFSYRKDEEIYGEGEPAEYLYQIISGAVRTYKLLSDGRRQIGAFHLPGDVFGLDPGSEHRLTADLRRLVQLLSAGVEPSGFVDALGPSSGVNVELTSVGRPLRKLK